MSRARRTEIASSLMHAALACSARRRRLILLQSQVVSPEFFALNATNGAIGNFLLCRAIIDHMDRKPAAQVPENAKLFNCLASGPKQDL